MTTVSITNLETDEKVGELDADGEVTTDDEELREAVAGFRSEGIVVRGDERGNGGRWKTKTVRPSDEGFARAVCYYLSSPYYADYDERGELPPYSESCARHREYSDDLPDPLVNEGRANDKLADKYLRRHGRYPSQPTPNSE